MNKYVWIALAISLLLNVGSYFYFNARLDSKDATIALEQNKVKEAVADVALLNAEVIKLNNIVGVKDVEYANAKELFEEYKRRVSNIKPQTVTSVKTIIKEVPAELVVVQANETSNEILRRINTSADDFKRVRDQD